MATDSGLVLLDTDVLIEIQRATPASDEWLSQLEGNIALPAPVAWEMMRGSRNAQELRRAKEFLAAFSVEMIDTEDTMLVQRLTADYTLSTGLSIPDFVIAVQSINRQATLYSFNIKHFSSIAGLNVFVPFVR